MRRNTTLALLVVCATTVIACSGTPDTPLSPSGAAPADAALNPDGSSLKVGAPTDLSPNGGSVDSLRPSLSFTTPAGRHVNVGYAYEIEVQNEAGNVVYSRVIGESSGSSTHAVESDLSANTQYWWRVRAVLEGRVGPWSEGFAMFRTPAPAAATPTPATPGSLPFPVPAECGPFGPGDRTACVIAMTAVSPWWAACQAGSGTNCHRFTRSVAAALATYDSGWGLLSKNPGEQQCTWNSCGPGAGNGYGEDVVTHHDGRTLRGWDIIGGAGAPGARPGWSRLEAFRAGNFWVPVPLPLGRD